MGRSGRHTSQAKDIKSGRIKFGVTKIRQTKMRKTMHEITASWISCFQWMEDAELRGDPFGPPPADVEGLGVCVNVGSPRNDQVTLVLLLRVLRATEIPNIGSGNWKVIC